MMSRSNLEMVALFFGAASRSEYSTLDLKRSFGDFLHSPAALVTETR